MLDLRFDPAPPFSDQELREIESVLGREVPEDYRAFVQQYGGAFVGGLVDGAEELPVLTFFGADAENGVLSKLRTHPDLREERALPFADCELGNLYVLDRQNVVRFINFYGGSTSVRKVADSFNEFLSRIVVQNE